MGEFFLGLWKINTAQQKIMRVLCILISTLALAAHAKQVNVYERMADETLEEFNEEFNIVEGNLTEEEKEAERAKLQEEEDEINENNNDPDSPFKEALNEWSDLSDEEFLKEKTGVIRPEMRGMGMIMPPLHERMEEQARNQPELDAMYNELSSRSVPASYNAVSKGLVTPVKDQGTCGSCVAFASAALFESSMIKAGANKTGLNLSEQYLIDCAYGQNGARGCNGANPFSYPKWLPTKGGHLPHENSYKYLGSSPKLNCKSAPKKMWNSGAKVSKTAVDWKCNETKLKSLIYAKGAVSITVYAAENSFKNYKSGVYNKCKSVKEGNHQVLAVGWGTENGKKYWLIKNSWGANWGLKGYFKIERGSSIVNTKTTNHPKGKTGMCGVEEMCITADSTKAGKRGSTPTVKPTTATKASSWCKVSWFPKDRAGIFTLRMRNPMTGALNSVKVKCVKGSKCTPVTKSTKSACKAICGRTSC